VFDGQTVQPAVLKTAAYPALQAVPRQLLALKVVEYLPGPQKGHTAAALVAPVIP